MRPYWRGADSVATFPELVRYGVKSAGENVMGERAIDVGNHIKSKVDSAGICGAMAQQRRIDGADDNESTPQKFVQLVGCRDPNAGKVPLKRPRPPSPKS